MRRSVDGESGRFGPSILGTGHRMDNREPQSCFKGLIGLGVATTTSSLFSFLHPQTAASPGQGDKEPNSCYVKCCRSD